MAVRITKVESRRDRDRFIKFPWEIYRDNPNWVPPLLMEMKEKLDPRRHPFFEHGEADLFLAEKDGRLTADRSHLDRHNDYHRKNRLLRSLRKHKRPQTATAHQPPPPPGKERGWTSRGPVNLSMNDSAPFSGRLRFATGLHDALACLYISHGRCVTKARDLYASLIRREHESADKVRLLADKVQKEMKITVRRADKTRMLDETRAIAAIYNDGWSRNWGFVPWTEAEMAHMVKRLVQFADLDFVLFAEHEGQPVGFAFALPNYSEILIKMNGRILPWGWWHFLRGRKRIRSARALVFGVLQSYFHTGVSYLLYTEFEGALKAKGCEWAEVSWLLEDNEAINRFNASIGARIYKKYRIFERKIAG
jgi:hypothetical protein